jgi:uncharacterized membrane protein YdfJ with MMPL/SSD domain
MDWLARLVERRARRMLIVAAILFVAAGGVGAGVADRLHPYGAEDPDTESVIADRRLEDAGFRETAVVVLVEVDPRSPGGRSRIDAITRELQRDREVASVSSFVSTGSTAFISRDGESTYLAVALQPTDDDALQDAAARIADSLADTPGVSVGGPAAADSQVNEQLEQDLRRAELFAFPLLFLLSLLFFRSLVAALLPLLVGVLAIVGTLAMLRVASELTSVSIFALNIAVGLGLGLGIDYSLFIVSRYREEVARTGPGLEAMRRTLATAGRTVLFSALTVAGALASLLVFPQRFLYSMGLGGLFVALIAAAIALVVLPAVLMLLGRRVNALTPAFLARRAERDARPARDGLWYGLSRLVQRFPGRLAAASAALLIALAIPFLGIEFTAVDAQALPTSLSARQVDDTLRAEFPPFRDTPVTLAVRGDEAAAERIAAAAAATPGVAAVNPPVQLEGGVWAVNVISTAPPLAEESQRLVGNLRDLEEETLVTGFTAGFVDLQESLRNHLPLFLGLVAAVTLVVLFLMTGSLVLPLMQLVMSALGVAAALGLLVLTFQDGRLEGLLDYTSQGGLFSTQMLFVFAVAFGLSTDYGLFLLSRIKEARDAGFPNGEAVAAGLERAGRIVTAAALLFSIAVGAFVTSEIAVLKQLGLGIALAVLIDAFVARTLLVPPLMLLLGRRSWWAPVLLRRLYARIRLSET